MKNKSLISSLSPLKPFQITDLTTGEITSIQEHNIQITQLINYVQKEVSDYYTNNAKKLEQDIVNDTRSLKPSEWARQNGYKLDTSTLNREVKAKSRIEKLYQHKLISEVSSYVNNPNPNKKPPSFSPKINLGAVDKQMATISIDDSILTVRFKVWEKDYLLDFKIPDYVFKREIVKWSLPTIELRKGIPYYIFSIQEKPEFRKDSNISAGLDLGRKEPYTMVVVNERGNRIADYKTAARVRQLNDKRERILKEKAHILKKAAHFDKLGLNSDVLKIEAKFKAGKALILGNEVAKQVGADVVRKLLKHDLNILAVEDLSWVHGNKYGSKWAHSKIQEKIIHATSREGIRVKKVNPKNSSQLCHLCNSRVVHNSVSRIAKCIDCKEKFDRDFNAAMNIAHKIAGCPLRKSRNGDKCSSKEQLIEKIISHNSMLKKSSKTTMTT